MDKSTHGLAARIFTSVAIVAGAKSDSKAVETKFPTSETFILKSLSPMKTHLRRAFAVILILCAGLLFALGFQPAKSPHREELELAFQKLKLGRATKAKAREVANLKVNLNVPSPPNAPTFGHPIIAGIGGTGFEDSIRIDPTLNANGDHTIYTSQ